jgi:hypothetical protein
MLPPALVQQARELIALHAPAMREEHMDEGVCSGLLRMAPGDASALLYELAANNLQAVRNVSGYLMVRVWVWWGRGGALHSQHCAASGEGVSCI